VATRAQLNSFRFSIYIDADGTVTLTDLPPELREVVEALDPAHRWAIPCAISSPSEAAPPAGDSMGRQAPSEDLGETKSRG
jgi:hypothetical protein